jgi:prophage regulatory protein
MEKQVRTVVFMLTLHQVMQRTGLSRSTIYSKLDPNCQYYDPSFPTQVRLGNGSAVRWIEAEIETWLEHCVIVSRASNPISIHGGAQ